MPSFSRTTIVGHCGKNADCKQVNDKNVLTFSVAVSNKYKDKQGQEQTDTQWYDVEYWCKTNSIGQYLTKGKPVLVSGEMRSRNYEDKQGVKRTIWVLRASEIQLLGGREEAPKEAAPAPEPVAQNKGAQALQEKFGAKITTGGGDLPF